MTVNEAIEALRDWQMDGYGDCEVAKMGSRVRKGKAMSELESLYDIGTAYKNPENALVFMFFKKMEPKE